MPRRSRHRQFAENLRIFHSGKFCRYSVAASLWPVTIMELMRFLLSRTWIVLIYITIKNCGVKNTTRIAAHSKTISHLLFVVRDHQRPRIDLPQRFERDRDNDQQAGATDREILRLDAKHREHILSSKR